MRVRDRVTGRLSGQKQLLESNKSKCHDRRNLENLRAMEEGSW